MKMLRLLVPLAALLCMTLAGAASAGVVAFYDANGVLTYVESPKANDVASALNALVGGPSNLSQKTAIAQGTQIVSIKVEGNTIIVQFSPEILAGVIGDDELARIYDQVKATLAQFGLDEVIRLEVNGKLLSDYLAPVLPVSAGPVMAPAAVSAAAAGSALTGQSVTLSPGHGLMWNGSGWVTQRPVYCSPLSEEDYHNIDIVQYLKSYLEADGMTVKMVREMDKSLTGHSSGNPWWKLASYVYLQNAGYPCSVYASYTGDCTTGTGASESNDDIRARPLASNYDNTGIYISVHTNGLNGDCTGGTCATGSETYYDLSSTEHKQWGTISQALANNVHTALMNAITQYADASWVCHGACTKDSAGNYGEIRIPTRAAILTELAFHDTCDRDALRLRDPFFTSTAMWGMYKGVCDYYGVVPTWGYYSDEYVSDDIPASLAPGETRQVHITFRNRGVVWNEGHSFRLGAVDDTDPFSASNRCSITGDVAPGQTYTFTLNFTAPTTAGNYITDWRMVRDGFAWFGDTLTKSISVGGAPDSEAPSVPANLAATAVSPTQINLSWTASTDNVGVAGYKIFRGGVQIGGSTTTTYSDTTCSSNTTYSYTVSAYDGNLNESAQSAPASATTPIRTEYILDNNAASFTGTWTTGTSSTDKYGSDYRYVGTASSETATAIWQPALDADGYYDVYVWYPQGANRTTAAPYIVYWNGGSQMIAVNQQANGGMWNKIASSKPFLAGTSGYVKLGNATGEASLVVLADAVRFVKVAADTTAPIISSVAAAPLTGGAKITWTTDEASTSQVEYGLTTAYGSLSALNTSMVTSHSVTLSGLSRRTTYHYRVRSKDAAGNEAISGDYTFKSK